MKRIVLLLLIFNFQLSTFNYLFGQRPNQAYWDYIEKYKTMAQDQMQRHQIPASITLAQGLLESAAGRSDLAVRANNHFGIKVGMGWTGPWVVKSDDRPDDRFRKYNSVAESYEDHSQFLLKPRYQKLFLLSTTDLLVPVWEIGEAHLLVIALPCRTRYCELFRTHLLYNQPYYQPIRLLRLTK